MTPAFDKKILEGYYDEGEQIEAREGRFFDFQAVQSHLYRFYQSMGLGGSTMGGEARMTPGEESVTLGGPPPGGPSLGMTPGMPSPGQIPGGKGLPTITPRGPSTTNQAITSKGSRLK